MSRPSLGDYTTTSANPKDVIGSDKIPIHLWPNTATVMGAMAMTEGALKYGTDNFRAVGIRLSIYVDAAMRHMMAFSEGEDIDPDSGLPHMAHFLACGAIIVDAMAKGNVTDDRHIAGGYRTLVNELTPHVARLREKHADKHPRHYTIQDSEEFK